jgi:hypothetical protein
MNTKRDNQITSSYRFAGGSERSHMDSHDRGSIAGSRRKALRVGWLWKVVRLALFVMVIQIVTLFVAARSSYARTNEMMMSVGAQMMRLADAKHQDRPRTIFLNGLALGFTSGSTEASVNSVLDVFHARCQKRNGRFAEQLDELNRRRPGKGNLRGRPLVDGVVHYTAGHKGMVACIDTGDEKLEPGEVIRRVKRFLATGQFLDIGELRYVLAERHGERTSFITFWTEGQANVLRAFSPEGDAPGRDPLEIPRPPNARRILSAWEKDQIPSLNVYSGSSSDLETLARFYRERLKKGGWNVTRDFEKVKSATRNAIFAERGERTVTITLTTGSDNRAVVTVLEMG